MIYRNLPTYFISHGGGPWPWMEGESNGAYGPLEAALKAMPAQIGSTPKAVLLISADSQEPESTVMSSANSPMIYDYSGLPEHTYRIRYAAPGSSRIAERVRARVAAAGVDVRLDPLGGFDHGTFAPLAVIYPDADVPVFELSLRHGCDPAVHIAIGRALAPLRSEGVLIIGSGLSYHNLRALGAVASEPTAAFDLWLQHTLLDLSPNDRIERLLNWESAPSARQAYPQEDHLLPLMVAVGAAGNDCGACVYHQNDFFGPLSVSSFMFGSTARAHAQAFSALH